jgi:hypothetical protein
VGKWGNGPAIADCLAYLARLDREGGLFTTILLLPDGSLHSPHVTFCIMSVHKQTSIGTSSGVCTMYSGYPSSEHSTFEGAFLRALMEHDKRLERGWMVGG